MPIDFHPVSHARAQLMSDLHEVKLQLLKNKKQLVSKNVYGNVETFDDLTAPRIRFFNILKTYTNLIDVDTRRHDLVSLEKRQQNILCARTL